MKKSIILLLAGAIVLPVLAQDVVINEINYNSAPLFDTEDWIEFYNNSGSDIDMTGWVFKDGDDLDFFIFPYNTILEPGGYLVAVRDSVDFTTFFPNVHNFVGEVEFRLSNGGELIRLFDETDTIIDSLTYDDAPPWPTEPDGTGKTLELIDPFLPNHYPASWRASLNGHGSPGGENVYTSVARRSTGALPDGFRLSPAYPNPFNASAKICFSLPGSADITLRVYNIEGRIVSELLAGEFSAGNYETVFNANGLGSGVYFVRLSADGFEQTGKMLLLK